MKTIAIVGMGPRGTSLLERMITYIENSQDKVNVSFLLFEKNKEFGSGCHKKDLPKGLLANTIASQITMFYGEEMESFGPIKPGPCFYEWHTQIKKQPIGKSDYPSRSVLGEYLNYFYNFQIKRLKKLGISFFEINEEVIDIDSNFGSASIKTRNDIYKVDSITICSGHEDMEVRNDRVFDFVFSTEKMNEIPSGSEVGIQGMGLTAFDVISSLTEGRGGEFVASSSGGLEYISSGNEPFLNVFSRTGIFLSSRAYNDNTSFIYKPIVFKAESIEYMKKIKGKLDFELDVLPLLITELQIAYMQQGGEGALDTDYFFHPEKKLNFNDEQKFVESFCSLLKLDYSQSLEGKFKNPYKFCQDVVRDLRDVIRAATDFSGLNSESHKTLINKWQPIINKICVGPPYLRLMQLEALIRAGVCSVSTAANPTVLKTENGFKLVQDFNNEKIEKKIDYLIKARMPTINFNERKDTLVNNLKKKFRFFNNGGFQYGGLDIDSQHRVIDINGKPCENFHAIGLSSEGSKYFTLVLGRPGMVSTFLMDSNFLANKIYLDISSSESVFS